MFSIAAKQFADMKAERRYHIDMKKKHIQYHKDGSVWAKGNLVDGECDGYWEWFRTDGTKMRSGSFVKGIQTGEWTTYDKRGEVFKVTLMKNKKKKSPSA